MTSILFPGAPSAQPARREQVLWGSMGKVRKNPHAVALGRLGGKKGGPARALRLSAEQRTESATKAGKAGGTARAKKMTKAQRIESARKAALARWATAKKADSR